MRRERDFALIVGMRDEKRALALYSTDQEVMWPKHETVCVGVGDVIADYLLGHLYNAALTEGQLVKLCNFVMRETKDYMQHIGKETDSSFMPYVSGPGRVRRIHDLSIDLKLPKLSEVIDFCRVLASEDQA